MSIGKKTCERLTPGRSAIDPSFLLTRRSLYDYLVLLWQWIVNWWRKRGRFLKIPHLWVCSSLHSNNGLITAISLIPSRPEVYSFSCTYFSANKKWMCPSPLDFREVEKALGSWSIPCPLRSRSLPRPAPNPLSLCVLCDSSSTRRSWPEQWSGAAVMAGIALDGGAGGCWGRKAQARRAEEVGAGSEGAASCWGDHHPAARWAISYSGRQVWCLAVVLNKMRAPFSSLTCMSKLYVSCRSITSICLSS
jgi:hypothetical protein